MATMDNLIGMTTYYVKVDVQARWVGTSKAATFFASLARCANSTLPVAPLFFAADKPSSVTAGPGQGRPLVPPWSS
ncbi:Unknown protein [Striga hermonthica]|uniref:Uncharacterized protein n=1 Tax=Striga hermonthica TaxID=68872 RepID=A0A9N7NZA1_STRHE|nr:Unknown protein [Striga hermonthica]